MSAGAFKGHFFQDNVDRVQCVWRPRRREGDPRKHIAKMLNEVICHCCNEPRTDGPGEREFPGKIGDDGDGPLVLKLHVLTSTTERLRAIRVRRVCKDR